MHNCRFHHHDHGLAPALRESLEAALYAYFVAEEGGLGAPDAPPRLAELVADIARGCEYRSHTAGVPELAEKVSHEAVAWCDRKWAEVAEEDPFAGEEAELASFRATASAAASPPPRQPPLGERIHALRVRYPEAEATWRVYARAAAEAARADDKDVRDLRLAALARRVAATWNRLLSERRRSYERAFLKHALVPFIDKLNRDIPLMARAAEQVRNFFGESNRGWDLLAGDWQQVDWQGVEEAADALGEEPTVARLAELLGRSEHARREFTEERREEVTETRSVDLEALGRSEIEGISLGSDVESIIPAERALLADADTELVFSKRFVDDELLSFDYRSAREVEHTARIVTVRSRRRPLERGPIIACVDTSGSMTGRPERIAKATTLALAQIAARGRRDCYVIAFSTGIRSFDLGNLAALPELSSFLSYSFHGGTDLRPALEETLRQLETERYRRADVIVVSDFRVPKLLERQTERISAAQAELGTLFHSLTIADGAPVDPLHIFDFHWHYDTSTRDGGIAALAET
ncbi:MAG: VWA domain-containing protein [Spirochaetota bacterium]